MHCVTIKSEILEKIKSSNQLSLDDFYYLYGCMLHHKSNKMIVIFDGAPSYTYKNDKLAKLIFKLEQDGVYNMIGTHVGKFITKKHLEGQIGTFFKK